MLTLDTVGKENISYEQPMRRWTLLWTCRRIHCILEDEKSRGCALMFRVIIKICKEPVIAVMMAAAAVWITGDAASVHEELVSIIFLFQNLYSLF